MGDLSQIAEAAVIGSLLIGTTEFPIAFQVLDPSYFGDETRCRIFIAASQVVSEGNDPELMSIGRAYERKYKKRFPLEIASDCMEGKPTVDSPEWPYGLGFLRHYCDMVVEGYRLRGIARAAEGLQKDATSGALSPDSLQESAGSILRGFEAKGGSEDGSITEGLTEVADGLLANEENRGLALGFLPLDARIAAGIRPGGLVIVGGRPSMGKSTLVMNFALKLALRKKSTLFVSLEVNKEMVQETLLKAASGCNLKELKADTVRRNEAVGILESCSTTLHLATQPKGKLTPSSVEEMVRRYKREFGLDVLIIDYLQLMGGDGRFPSRREEVESVSAALKRLASSEEIVIIALSQLSRAVDERVGQQPVLRDLREGGGIEQDADVCLLLRRESYYEPGRNFDPRADQIDVIVAKNRFGGIGVVKLGYDLEASRITDHPVRGKGASNGHAETPHPNGANSDEELPF